MQVNVDETDKRGFDATIVLHAQAGKKYRLLNVNKHNMARKSWRGWEIVTGGPERLAIDASTPIKKGADLDSTRGYSDVVLASMPIEKWEERIAKPVRELQRQRNASIERQFKNSVGRGGFSDPKDTSGAYSGQMTESQFNATQAGA